MRARLVAAIAGCAVLGCMLAGPALAAPPANDDFADSAPTTPPDDLPASASGTNVDATFEPGEPENPNDAGGASVWFEWRAPADGTVAIDTCGSDFDTILAVYTGTSLAALTPQVANDDGPNDLDCGPTETGYESQVKLGVSEDRVLMIQVDGYEAETGTVDLNVVQSDPVVSVESSLEVTEGNAGTADAEVAVRLSEPVGEEVTANLSTDDGAANEPEDYADTQSQVTFDPGDVSKHFTVPVNGDTEPELDENFYVDLVDYAGPAELGVGNPYAEATILNDDGPPPVLKVSDADVTEGNSGTSVMNIDVTLANPLPGEQATVDYFTLEGPLGPDGARSPQDYTDVFGTLTFAPGDTSETIAVPVVGDTIDEQDEFFGAIIFNPANAYTTFDSQIAVGTILDDDLPPAPPPGNGGNGDTGGTGGSGGTGETPGGVAPPTPLATKQCVVPDLKGMKVGAAEDALADAGCRLGKLTKKAVKRPKPGVVIKQTPPAGRVLAEGAKVEVTLSKKARKGRGGR